MDGGNDNDGNSDSGNDDKDNGGGGGGGRHAMAAANGMVGASIRQPAAAEMGIKQKWEQCGYDRWKILFSKIVSRVYFFMYP